MRLSRITELDTGLIIPGLPENLKRVPTESDAWLIWKAKVLAYRKQVRRACDSDEQLQRDVWNLCAQDPAYFCLIYGIIFEPRWVGDTAPGWHPWILYPFQVEMIRWIVDVAQKTGPRKHGVIEKSRDMGASWICCLIAVHFFLFAKAGKVGFSSRNKEEVDMRGNPKSLFSKLRGLLTVDPAVEAADRLPDYIFPKGWGKQSDKDMLLTHPSKPVTISGSTTTSNAGRGDRTTYWFNDEAAFNQYYGPARASQVSTADHIFSVSSAGMDDGGAFKAEVEQAIAAQGNPHLPGSSYLRLEWDIHPFHDQVWYDNKRAEMNDDHAFAREVDIDYMAGQGDWVYPKAQRILPGLFPYQPTGGPLYCVIDPGLSDPTAIAYAQYDPAARRLRWVQAILVNNMDAMFIGSLLVGKRITDPEHGYTTADYAPFTEFMTWTASLKRTVEYVGDPYGNQKGGDGRSTFYETLGRASWELTDKQQFIAVQMNFDNDANSYKRRTEATNTWLPRMDFDDTPGVVSFLTAIQQARYPEMRPGSITERLKPKHDWTSHNRSVCEYMSVHLDIFDRLSAIPRASEVVIVNLGGTTGDRKVVPLREGPRFRDDNLRLGGIR